MSGSAGQNRKITELFYRTNTVSISGALADGTPSDRRSGGVFRFADVKDCIAGGGVISRFGARDRSTVLRSRISNVGDHVHQADAISLILTVYCICRVTVSGSVTVFTVTGRGIISSAVMAGLVLRGGGTIGVAVTVSSNSESVYKVGAGGRNGATV